MQLFSVLHKSGMSGFGNIIQFVPCSLTGRVRIYSLAVHTFPMLNINAQYQKLLMDYSRSL